MMFCSISRIAKATARVAVGHHRSLCANCLLKGRDRVLRKKCSFYPIVATEAHRSQYSSSHKSLSIENPSVLSHLSDLLNSYKNGTLCRTRMKEIKAVDELMRKRSLVLENMKSLMELQPSGANDEELRRLATEELLTYQEELDSLSEQIIEELVPKGKHHTCNEIMLEVQAGAGGQEAMLFAAELFGLYQKFAVFNGWSFTIETFDRSDLGGIRSAVAFVSGKGSYLFMQNEIGVHRVQRAPATDLGRIHTSTAAVIVMPQPTEVEIKLSTKDLEFETMRSGGPGGQNVNKVESAVRLKHLLTGVTVECSTSRHQSENKALALTKLRTKLFGLEEAKQNAHIKHTRLTQMGNRDRSEKIRTYNFQQDRITDHRLSSNMHNIKAFMEGGESLQKLHGKLIELNHRNRCAEYIASICD